MFLCYVYSSYVCFYLCSQAISVLLVALNIVYLLVDETAMPKGSSVRKVQVNKAVNENNLFCRFSLSFPHSLPPLFLSSRPRALRQLKLNSRYAQVCVEKKGWTRCLSCCCCLMLFIRAAPVDLLEVNSKALTHSTCVKLWKQISRGLISRTLSSCITFSNTAVFCIIVEHRFTLLCTESVCKSW